MNDIEQKLVDLLASIANTDEDEIDCDEFLDQVAGYVERFASNRDLSDEFWSMVQHMKICPECREEFETLLALHRSE